MSLAGLVSSKFNDRSCVSDWVFRFLKPYRWMEFFFLNCQETMTVKWKNSTIQIGIAGLQYNGKVFLPESNLLWNLLWMRLYNLVTLSVDGSLHICPRTCDNAQNLLGFNFTSSLLININGLLGRSVWVIACHISMFNFAFESVLHKGRSCLRLFTHDLEGCSKSASVFQHWLAVERGKVVSLGSDSNCIAK